MVLQKALEKRKINLAPCPAKWSSTTLEQQIFDNDIVSSRFENHLTIQTFKP